MYKIRRSALFLILTALAFVMMLPIFYTISISLKLPSEVFIKPMKWIPEVFHLENYITPLQEMPLLRWLFNSIVVAAGSTVLVVITSTMAGYSFAKFHYFGRNAIFGSIIATLMVPKEAFVIPLFMLIVSWGWLNTYSALIIPAGGSAFGIFLMRQYMLSVPDELIESARIDGANEFLIFRKIVLPLQRPAIATLVIFNFTYNWNSFLYPMLVISKNELRTLPIGLAFFESAYSINYPQLMAVSLLSILPVLVVFLLLQNEFIESISLSGLKG